MSFQISFDSHSQIAWTRSLCRTSTGLPFQKIRKIEFSVQVAGQKLCSPGRNACYRWKIARLIIRRYWAFSFHLWRHCIPTR
ncbi:unnamed protein product [Blepharisma stoltei]|uniref:Ribosomal protein S14 n=1 Tax=Blepharisma stoltei TaxID=1481888 RepID=A0AAU9K2L7_9CILI|nr:unnamed protein product [Blepharisma stoltei]